MGIRLMHTALADAIAAAHIVYFVGVVAGLIAIAVDVAPWTRNIWFRTIHFAAIAIVVVENLGAFSCPLNSVEWHLRVSATGSRETSIGVGGVLDQLLFHTISGPVLNGLWWLFARCAVFLLIAKPPCQSRPTLDTGLAR